MTKYPRESTFKEESFSLAYSFRGFSPWSPGLVALGLWHHHNTFQQEHRTEEPCLPHAPCLILDSLSNMSIERCKPLCTLSLKISFPNTVLDGHLVIYSEYWFTDWKVCGWSSRHACQLSSLQNTSLISMDGPIFSWDRANLFLQEFPLFCLPMKLLTHFLGHAIRCLEWLKTCYFFVWIRDLNHQWGREGTKIMTNVFWTRHCARCFFCMNSLKFARILWNRC
jgi:hypothetical protein